MIRNFLPTADTPLVAVNLQELTPIPLPTGDVHTVLCVGNFDGVHVGHIALIRKAQALSQKIAHNAADGKTLCGAWFFSTPTRPNASVLTPIGDKLSVMRELGLDIAFIAHFPSFMKMSPEEFTSVTLSETCNCKGVVCGYNFRYGRDGRGDALSLRADFPYATEIVDCVTVEGIPVSSSTVRRLLAEGDVGLAAQMLSRPYALVAPVVRGKMLGRQLGFPTANQSIPEELATPARGVYVTRVTVDGRQYAGVSNIGVRPTVENTTAVNCETYILDFEGDIYGKTVKTEFLSMLRPETKFNSVEELRAAVSENISQAREYFGTHQIKYG